MWWRLGAALARGEAWAAREVLWRLRAALAAGEPLPGAAGEAWTARVVLWRLRAAGRRLRSAGRRVGREGLWWQGRLAGHGRAV
ncbi:hypothetical protein [Nocardiopsis quinghaiensis]|uniref:hypothetical protein n=1 Tax=Nocardiopsis quinghaiensis TaxID=464995 RepID=UPI001239AE48|nr:hypothetical protein [Nocardiopsis quinghaiensis]